MNTKPNTLITIEINSIEFMKGALDTSNYLVNATTGKMDYVQKGKSYSIKTFYYVRIFPFDSIAEKLLGDEPIEELLYPSTMIQLCKRTKHENLHNNYTNSKFTLAYSIDADAYPLLLGVVKII